MTRRTTAIGIVLVWLAALAWLVRREYWRPQAERLAEAVRSLPPSATYYTISLGGKQVGYASSKVDTLTDSLRVTDFTSLTLPVMGTLTRTEARTDAVLSPTLRLRHFTASVRGDGPRFDASGAIDGDSVLALTLQGESDTQHFVLPLEGPIALPSLIPLNLTYGAKLRPGLTYAISVFDPTLLRTRDVHLTVIAESTFIVPDSAAFDSTAGHWVPALFDTLQAWQVRETEGDLPMTTWIDRTGQLVRMTSPMGFTLQRTAFEIAFENFRAREDTLAADPAAALAMSGDVVHTTAIAAHAALEPHRLVALTVRLNAVRLDGFDLDGARQTLSGDTLTVRRESGPQMTPHYRLPSHDASLGAFLAPEPLIQSDDPRIQAQARQIVGRERDPRRAAELLEQWVYQNLRKVPTISVPSAVDVLRTRQGDCNEHTVLYVALARAVGLPARTAAGLVYLGGSFYYHAWPEVYLDGWVAVDPTFGEFPADAAHLRFTIGGLARQMELIRLIGRLTIDVLHAQGGG